MRNPLPAVAVAVGFIDCINRTDVDGLAALMADGHSLHVFDEPPLVGRAANVEARRGYFASFPEYVIHPRRIAGRGGVAAILGHTTGSHLGLPDDEESRTTLTGRRPWSAVWCTRGRSSRTPARNARRTA